MTARKYCKDSACADSYHTDQRYGLIYPPYRTRDLLQAGYSAAEIAKHSDAIDSTTHEIVGEFVSWDAASTIQDVCPYDRQLLGNYAWSR